MENKFRIEVASNGFGHFYSVKPLGNACYQLFIEETAIGTIQLDKEEDVCYQSHGCELDLPLLKAIRDAIHVHLSMGTKA